MAFQNFLSDAIDPSLEGFGVQAARFSNREEPVDIQHNTYNPHAEVNEDLGEEIAPFSNTGMNKRRRKSEALEVDTSRLTLDNIDRFIKKTEARCGPDHEHVKQLKDHKRKLRNRQSATQSRLRQRQTSTVLWNEIKKQNAIISQHMAQLALLTFRERKSRARLRGLSDWASGTHTTHGKLALSELETNTSRATYSRDASNMNSEQPFASPDISYDESMTQFTPVIDTAFEQLLGESDAVHGEVGARHSRPDDHGRIQDQRCALSL
ncbi:hypothetical protein BJ508DRAFT_377009 [Ascobolus immersus RN42]|uniref:BZIP domain-containing protein n=1 Tax=Ascobolus immersus RN42 TaxID=1160509 RepID=A0A3N4I3E1_ASCIM|nr:hypothetical protein BJ508DRAFT_377009 [Ascobolus immersus RN42]